MSRWIDVEWLKQRINIVFWAEIGKIIDSAPSIEIVHCRECIYADKDAKAEMYRCLQASFPYWHNADYFCSDGEREGER